MTQGQAQQHNGEQNEQNSETNKQNKQNSKNNEHNGGDGNHSYEHGQHNDEDGSTTTMAQLRRQFSDNDSVRGEDSMRTKARQCPRLGRAKEGRRPQRHEDEGRQRLRLGEDHNGMRMKAGKDYDWGKTTTEGPQ
ncbi:unnamed protein product [Cyclocybe aegerita]|uniref:Uncharacterized protein n=1 Tax=Cyclocybe aegerita TaxID=1973307 RepID=A0A8S0VSQ6_CYCAE|nr:unnamed protein product [Cyclocybe aegerita]